MSKGGAQTHDHELGAPAVCGENKDSKKQSRKEAKRKKGRMHDPYFAIIQEQWPYILMFYKRFEDKKPVILFDIQEQRIYAYPYAEFKADLSERSQTMLEQQYERALADEKIVVFVRDNDKKKLVSYSLGQEDVE